MFKKRRNLFLSLLVIAVMLVSLVGYAAAVQTSNHDVKDIVIKSVRGEVTGNLFGKLLEYDLQNLLFKRQIQNLQLNDNIKMQVLQAQLDQKEEEIQFLVDATGKRTQFDAYFDFTMTTWGMRYVEATSNNEVKVSVNVVSNKKVKECKIKKKDNSWANLGYNTNLRTRIGVAAGDELNYLTEDRWNVQYFRDNMAFDGPKPPVNGDDKMYTVIVRCKPDGVNFWKPDANGKKTTVLWANL